MNLEIFATSQSVFLNKCIYLLNIYSLW